MHDDVTLTYAAGIVDGEGWIGMSVWEPKGRGKSPVFQAVIAVNMTDAEVPVWLAETFGGKVITIEHPGGPSRNCKPMHMWKLTADRAATVCRLLRPYLRIKHRQAELVIAYREDQRLDFTRHGGRGVRVPSDEIAVKREYAMALKTANARGEELS
jgi:hypothetical protein